MNGADDGAIDAVYTWVDDRFPGYQEELRRYASDKRDTNPNRTRDNLEVMRFSLRSLARHMPFLRRIYILSCRPQVPAWLDAAHPAVRIVHHDAIMDPGILPTFNSFAIVSHLHLLPGLSSRFVYFEDDMLAFRPLGVSDFLAPDGRPYVFLNRTATVPHDRLDRAKASPWNLALASADRALSQKLGPKKRRHIFHGPQLFDRDGFAAVIESFSEGIAATRASRFRAEGNLPPEYLYPHFMAETGAAAAAPARLVRRMEGYASLENFRPWTWAQMKALELRRPGTITLNDSFGARPNPSVVRLALRKLQQWFPDASPFERAMPVG